MFKERIYWKFSAYFLLFGTCVLSIALLLLNQHAQSYIRHSVEESTQFQHRRIDSALNYMVEAAVQPVVGIADSMEMNRYLQAYDGTDYATLNRWMQSILAASVSHYRIELYDESGAVRISYFTNSYQHIRQDQSSHGVQRFVPSKLTFTPSHPVYFTQIIGAQNYLFPDGPKIKVMEMITPVYKNGHGKIMGYVGMFINMTTILNVMTSNNNLDLFVVDKDGTIIATSEQTKHGIPTLQQRFDLTDINSPEQLSAHELTRYQVNYFNNHQGISVYSRAADSYITTRTKELHHFLFNIVLVVFGFSIIFGFVVAIGPSRTVSRLKRVSKQRNQYMKIMDKYVPVMQTDPYGHVTHCNSAFSILSGYSEEELRGQPASILSFNRGDGQSKDMWDALRRHLPWQGEFHNVSKTGREFWLFSTVIPIHKRGKIDHYICVSTDKTEKKKLELLAEMDSLTELYNRAKLDKCLIQEQERAKRYGTYFSVILLDVDFFKRVNDTYGHLTGDKVLHQLAIMLNKNTRVIDEVGRWGGEEFMIVCPETSLDEAVSVAEKVRIAVERYVFPEVGHITVSLGIALYDVDKTLEQTIDEADKYLYEAKKLGRNRVASRESKVTSISVRRYRT